MCVSLQSVHLCNNQVGATDPRFLVILVVNITQLLVYTYIVSYAMSAVIFKM